MLDMSTMNPESGHDWVVLLYGSPFCGKTHFLRTVPKPLIVHDFDNKIEPLYGVDGVTVRQYDSTDPSEVTKIWKLFLDQWKADISNPDVASVALDSLSNLDTIVLRHCMKMDGKPSSAMPEIQNYGSHNTEFRQFLYWKVTKVKGKHIFVLAHDHTHEDEKTKVRTTAPLVTGQKIFDHLPGMFKDVWHMEHGDTGKRTLHYKKYRRTTAGSLTLKGGGTIEEPTFEKVVEATKKTN